MLGGFVVQTLASPRAPQYVSLWTTFDPSVQVKPKDSVSSKAQLTVYSRSCLARSPEADGSLMAARLEGVSAFMVSAFMVSAFMVSAFMVSAFMVRRPLPAT